MLTAAEHRRLTRGHFLAQEERPENVREVEIAALDPFLRSLIFTDGTITRALGVRALAPVAVAKLEQATVPTPAEPATRLEIEIGRESVRRRVAIGVASRPPVVWAESHIAEWRLPPEFLELLEEAPQGIGQSLQRSAFESFRELLWFGLAERPSWAAAGPGDLALQRLYRIVSGGRAAIVIAETFSVEAREGALGLAGFAPDRQPPEGENR
jgi:chorismate-pyruvate lyase